MLRVLGGVRFALVLITATSLFVVAGTFLESITQSHRYAAIFTYQHPFFTALLVGFFINILFAALRRWPFHWRHIPFLITHFGLLMILSGVIIKQYWGVQGNMLIKEGGASREILLPDKPVVRVDTPKGKQLFHTTRMTIGDLSLSLIDKYPHSSERWEGWFKQDHLYLRGIKPLALGESTQLFDGEGQSWTFLAASEEISFDAPGVLFVKPNNEDEHLIVKLPDGTTFRHTYANHQYESLFEVNNGFGGYWIQAAVTPEIVLYTPLSKVHQVETPSSKLEEHLPLIRVKATSGKQSQIVPLTYDPLAKGLRWPILEGKALLRYQPAWQELPYQVRLRQARKVNYPNSNQAYSYEADIVVKDLRSQKTTETTLCMNQVYETEDGYRFYLSNISQTSPHTARQIQLAVNHDPAKYWLTYPGGSLVSLGILLLFAIPRKQTRSL